MDKKTIIDAIEAHAAATGLKPTSIGQMAVRNRHIYGKLQTGGDIQLGTAAALLEWMQADLKSRGVSNGVPKAAAPLKGAQGSGSLPAAKNMGASQAKCKGAA